LKISLHEGFAKAARAIHDDLQSRLAMGDHILITGHSLGGAEAVILGMMLTTEGKPVDAIVTFGQPKVTDPAGVNAFKNLPLTRVINQDDIVPELPPGNFSHIGPALVLFPGANYSVVDARPIQPAEILAAWQSLRQHKVPPEIPQHYIANYLVD